MARIIDPPRGSFGELPAPLTPGESEVVDFFDRTLVEDWEIYVQPFLNGLRPDIVLLNPRVGIAVFEVKDWDFSAVSYSVKSPKTTDEPVLCAVNREGKGFRPEDPIRKVDRYQNEIFDLYCPRLDQRSGLAVITAGVIMTRAARWQVEDNLERIRQHFLARSSKRAPYLVIATREDLASGRVERVFPSSKFSTSKFMSPAHADDLRGWLREPALSRDQREPLQLDAGQRQLVSSRTETGYRRIRGPAGSGKSLVLAARASELAASGLNVLVVSFNITLLNYLRDLAVRHVASRGMIRRQISFLNFHAWGRRVCMESGNEKAYKEIWKQKTLDEVLDDGLADLVSSIYRDPRRSDADEPVPRYDAILVDEGQDFRLSWWNTLRLALSPDGEMVLAADRTQDIYSTASAWTDSAMNQAGFRGPWSEMKVSYRLPPKGIELSREFASSFLGGEVLLPESEPQMDLEDLFPSHFRWVQLDDSSDRVEVFVTEYRRMSMSLGSTQGNADLTLLAGKDEGRRIVEAMEARGVRVLHTFGVAGAEADEGEAAGSGDSRLERRQKMRFFQGDAKLKATTLHSFKGWESRNLLVFLPKVSSREDLSLVYIALTRIKRDESGSRITVICGSPGLRDYGRRWPEYREGIDPIE